MRYKILFFLTPSEKVIGGKPNVLCKSEEEEEETTNIASCDHDEFIVPYLPRFLLLETCHFNKID